MTIKNLNVLRKEVDDERSCVCPFHSNDSCHPVPKLGDQAVEEDGICQIDEPTVDIEEEGIEAKIEEIEECSINFEPVHLESEHRRCLVQEEALGHKNHRVCEEVQDLIET